jgi:hypothetical protein
MFSFTGGWPGGMWAMEKFRHKTSKEAFRTPYFMAVGANVVAFGGLGYLAYSKGGAASQGAINDLLNSPLGKAVKSEARKAVNRMGRR